MATVVRKSLCQLLELQTQPCHLYWGITHLGKASPGVLLGPCREGTLDLETTKDEVSRTAHYEWRSLKAINSYSHNPASAGGKGTSEFKLSWASGPESAV